VVAVVGLMLSFCVGVFAAADPVTDSIDITFHTGRKAPAVKISLFCETNDDGERVSLCQKRKFRHHGNYSFTLTNKTPVLDSLTFTVEGDGVFCCDRIIIRLPNGKSWVFSGSETKLSANNLSPADCRRQITLQLSGENAGMVTAGENSPEWVARFKGELSPDGSEIGRLRQLRSRFDELMRGGKLALDSQRWQDARRYFNEALQVDGYEDNEAAVKGLTEAQYGIDNGQKADFAAQLQQRKDEERATALLAQGKLALSRRAWKKAEDLYREVLTIKGHERDRDAELGLRMASNRYSGGDTSGAPKMSSPSGNHPKANCTWQIPGLVLTMVYVAPGSFECGGDVKNGGLSHLVTLTRGYWIGKFEVMQQEYESVTGFKKVSRFRAGERPVEMVSWNDAMFFCAQLTIRERKQKRLPKGYVYRLPTEAEWEFAARGGVSAEKTGFSGGNDIKSLGWCRDNSDRQTHPVGQLGANSLGISDMSGNVWEWCYDWMAPSPSTEQRDPVGQSHGELRVIRGGAYTDPPQRCRVDTRHGLVPDKKNPAVGFRVVLAPEIGNIRAEEP